MFDPTGHPSQAELIQYIDGEASSAQAAAIRDHITHCPACHAHVESARQTLRNLDGLFATPTHDASSSRLRLQQAMARARARRPWWKQHTAGLAVAAMLLFAAGLGLHQWQTSHERIANALPNRSLTPGFIRPVTIGEICSVDADDSRGEDQDPDVPPAIQRAVLSEYGIRTSSPGRSYQIDYLVNPQLGGTNDIRNLWPQPYHSAIWNAEAKDELEKRLHQMVCDHTVDLAVAQQEIETDWIAAYKKYIHARRPG